MQSPWKRTLIGNRAQLGRKIVEWTLNPGTRPTTIAELEGQLPGALKVKDHSKTTKVQFIDTPMDTILIKLPPAEIIKQAVAKYSNPTAKVEDFPFPSYYPVDIIKLKASSITVEEIFYALVGDYTTTECE